MTNVCVHLSAGTTITDLYNGQVIILFSFRAELDNLDMYNESIPTEWRKMYRWRRYTKQLVIDKSLKEQLESLLPKTWKHTI